MIFMVDTLQKIAETFPGKVQTFMRSNLLVTCNSGNIYLNFRKLPDKTQLEGEKYEICFRFLVPKTDRFFFRKKQTEKERNVSINF